MVNRIMFFELCSESTQFILLTKQCTSSLVLQIADFVVVTIYNLADRHQDTSVSEENIASILRTDSSIYHDTMWCSLCRQMETVHSCKTFISTTLQDFSGKKTIILVTHIQCLNKHFLPNRYCIRIKQHFVLTTFKHAFG
jgi:hypothetical protein